ncbi:hypothetical protein AVEN_18421-1 [Araneus ventricosus]|uniref:Uncharacterized protein n=1 Tax=Araneus ventricosus TaxID=182803 RepID=A0A4Y2G8I8_ARAVE|nr:hypothetical protein AVEN_18421-1 [Araneus ventricosus]
MVLADFLPQFYQGRVCKYANRRVMCGREGENLGLVHIWAIQLNRVGNGGKWSFHFFITPVVSHFHYAACPSSESPSFNLRGRRRLNMQINDVRTGIKVPESAVKLLCSTLLNSTLLLFSPLHCQYYA